MTIGISDLALAPRGQDEGSLPGTAYPFYSVGFLAAIAAGSTTPAEPIRFVAPRDTLFTDLSIVVTDDVTGSELEAEVSVEHCNTQYIDRARAGDYAACCARKPIFLVGVREDKRLEIQVALASASVNASTVKVELSGFQGNGCCS